MSEDDIINELLTLSESDQKLNKVWEVLSLTPDERLDELAELYVDFTQKHNLLLEFIASVIKREVESTKQQMVLFREDCFAIKCINRILFSDIGKKYLVRLVSPLVTSTLSYTNLLEVTSELYKKDKKTFEKNMEAIIKLLSSFLQSFAKSHAFCPILFREIFAKIQTFVDLKFGQHNNSPLVLDFIFFKFICPAIIHPQRYQLIPEEEEISLQATRSLVNISKILNNIAHNVDEKYEEKHFEKLQNFIKKNHPILIDNLARLLDPEDIARTKEIVSSNVLENTINKLEKQECADALRRFARSIYSSGSSEESSNYSSTAVVKPDTATIFKLKTTEALNFLNDSSWKYLRTLKSSNVYLHQEPRKTKIIMPIKVNAKKLFDYIRDIAHLNIIVPQDIFIGSETFHETENYKEFRMLIRSPAPLNNREFLMTQWDICDDNRYIIFGDVIPSHHAKSIPRLQGTVRGDLKACWQFEKIDEQNTRLTFAMEMDPKGSIPAWAANYLVTHAYVYHSKMPALLEKSVV